MDGFVGTPDGRNIAGEEVGREDAQAHPAGQQDEDRRQELPPSMAPPPAVEFACRRPMLFYGDLGQAGRSDGYVEAVYGKMQLMAKNISRIRKSVCARTWVTWVTGDPENWATSIRPMSPRTYYPAEQAAALMVGFARPGREGRCPEAWSIIAPLAINSDGLLATGLPLARTVFTGDDRLRKTSPPLFSDHRFPAAPVWLRFALTGVRILADAHVNNLDVPLAMPDFFCRTTVTTDTEQKVVGWGPRNRYLVGPAVGTDRPDVAVMFDKVGHDRMFYEEAELWMPPVWREVPHTVPWSVVDAPMCDPDGRPIPVGFGNENVTINVRPA